jgi:hypothetical protein
MVIHIPVPSCVDRDTTTSLPRLAVGGVVSILEHTIADASPSTRVVDAASKEADAGNEI